MVLPRRVYVCTRCDKVHHGQQDAIDCCPTDIAEQWECTECGTVFDTEQEAHDCCIEEDVS